MQNIITRVVSVGQTRRRNSPNVTKAGVMAYARAIRGADGSVESIDAVTGPVLTIVARIALKTRTNKE